MISEVPQLASGLSDSKSPAPTLQSTVLLLTGFSKKIRLIVRANTSVPNQQLRVALLSVFTQEYNFPHLDKSLVL
jgi:hypothetical protein